MNDAQIIQWAKSVWQNYAKRLETDLGIDNLKMPTFKVGDLDGGSGSTDGNVITLDRNWMRTHPNDPGLVIHEAVHAAQTGTGIPAKWIEPFADAMRERYGLDDYNWEPSEQASRIADLRPWQLEFVSAAMTSGEWQPGLLGAIETSITREAWETAKVQSAGSGVVDAALGAAGVVANAVTLLLGGEVPGVDVSDIDTTFNPGNTPGGDDGGLSRYSKRQRELAKARRKQQKQRYERDQAAALRGQLSSLGIAVTPNLEALIAQAAGRHYSMATFMEYLRETPEYAAEFKGIFEKDGTLRMTEQQYIQTMTQYDSIATQAGIDLDKGDKVWAIKHDVTATELASRASAVSTLERNAGTFKAFERELIQGGMAPQGGVDRQDMLRFVLKQDNAEWKDVWQDAQTRYAATQAGIAFSKKADGYMKLGQGVIEHVSSLDLTPAEMESRFREVEDAMAQGLPAARILSLGLRKKDLVKATFGGKGSGEARRQFERVMENYEAQEQNVLAAPASYVGEGGRLGTATGRGQGGATE